jgi:hypothetical protein
MREQVDNTTIARHFIWAELSEPGRNHLNIELNIILIGILTNKLTQEQLYDYISELKLDLTGKDNLTELVEKLEKNYE